MSQYTKDNPRYLFPQITENTPKEPFSFTVWNGFAVTQEERTVIHEFLNYPHLTAQFAQLYKKGKVIRSTTGEIVIPNLIMTDVIGIRFDGPIVVLNALVNGHYPPDPNTTVNSFRKKGLGKGTFFTALVDLNSNSEGKIDSFNPVTEHEAIDRVKRTSGFYEDSSLLEAANALLLSQVKSDELELGLLSQNLKESENLESFEKSFKVTGPQLAEYLNRVKKERGSILWGVSSPILQRESYRYGRGDFSTLNEIDIRNSDGFLPMSEISFISMKPYTLEDKLGQICQSMQI